MTVMPWRCASRGERRRTRAPVAQHLAGVRRERAAEDAPERRLPGAVLADQRVDGARGDLDGDVARARPCRRSAWTRRGRPRAGVIAPRPAHAYPAQLPAHCGLKSARFVLRQHDADRRLRRVV